MNHPTTDDLLRYAVREDSSAEFLAGHLRDCPVCRAEVSRLRLNASLLRATAHSEAAATPECLDDNTIAIMASGDATGDDRAIGVKHMAMCAACRRRVASVARALADPAVAREIVAADQSTKRSRLRSRTLIPLAAAAAAVLLFVVSPRRSDEGVVSHRAPTLTAGAVPTLIFPVGTVSRADTLRWAAVDGADRYRVTLFDAAGNVVHEAQLSETAAALPDAIQLAAGRPYLWKVEARTAFDRWSASDLVEFSLVPRGRR